MKTAYMFKRLFFGALKTKLEAGLTNSLQNSLMPKINNMIAGTNGYGHFIEGLQFDASLQKEPTMNEKYMGLEMTGIFSPQGGPDLTPSEFEMNNTDASLPVHDESTEGEREKMEFFLHQMSLTSMLVSYMKVSTLECTVD